MRNQGWSVSAVLLVLLMTQGLEYSVLLGQQGRIDPLIFDLLRAQESFRSFDQERADTERRLEQERLQVPGYNIQLSRTVAQFHQHIQDMHFRHENCQLCRRYTRQIRELANRIDSVMK